MGEGIEEITNKIMETIKEMLEIDQELVEYTDSLDGTTEIDEKFLLPTVVRRAMLQIELIAYVNEYKRVKKAIS